MTRPKDSEPRMGTRPLPEIERPFQYREKLDLLGDALVINTDAILSYRFSYEGRIIMVARERTQPVIKRDNRNAFAYPYPNADQLRGLYGVIFVDFNLGSNRVIYIGEEYKVMAESSEKEVGLTIEATKPIRFGFIPGDEDYIAVLERLNSRTLRSLPVIT